MRFAMTLACVVVLSACGSSEKKPATAPANQADPGSNAAPPPPTRDAELEKAQRDAEDARRAAEEATAQVERLAKDLEDLDSKVGAAVDMVVAAQNDADRASAKAKLEQLRKEKAEMDARIQAARDAAQKAVRKQGQKISKECQDNPLAKGCS